MNQPTAGHDFSRHQDRIAARALPVSAAPRMGLHKPGAPGREALEARIAGKFAQQYGAHIRHFLPYLLDLSVAGKTGAIAGLRPAGHSALFLEQYLDRPVEQAVSRAYSTPVDRDQVVEIGNLVSLVPGAASLLFGLLPTLFARAGFRWMVCTATPQVRSMLRKLDFATRTVCDADPGVLGERQHDWGSYYDSRPQVIVGDVRDALNRSAVAEPLRCLIAQRGNLIDQAVSALRAAG